MRELRNVLAALVGGADDAAGLHTAAACYQQLGIEWDQVMIKDFTGRPRPIITNGQPIPGLSA